MVVVLVQTPLLYTTPGSTMTLKVCFRLGQGSLAYNGNSAFGFASFRGYKLPTFEQTHYPSGKYACVLLLLFYHYYPWKYTS